MKNRSQPEALRARQQILPGGVNSPVRAFQAVGGTPLFVRARRAPRIEDVDGNRYIDYVMSWGPLIHGHAPAGLVQGARRARRGAAPASARRARSSTSWASACATLMPSMERVRFVSSGTEAAMSAVRVARAFTGRDKIVKFEGCYHGHADAFLVKAGSGATTLGVPDSPGRARGASPPTRCSRATTTSASVDALLRGARPDRSPRVIVEPIAGNMGVVPPADGFLRGPARALHARTASLLIFDEVISGFRASAGGAQALFGVAPDLTCLGKIIGGGLPVGAYGGRADIMELVAPAGPVYQAGTLSGNPLAMTAGLWALEAADAEAVQGAGAPRLDARRRPRRRRARRGRAAAGQRVRVAGHAVLHRVTRCATTTPRCAANTGGVRVFFRGMLARGVYPPPSQFEAWFLSAAHTDSARQADRRRGARGHARRGQGDLIIVPSESRPCGIHCFDRARVPALQGASATARSCS